jgi:hypothetical protein
VQLPDTQVERELLGVKVVSHLVVIDTLSSAVACRFVPPTADLQVLCILSPGHGALSPR